MEEKSKHAAIAESVMPQKREVPSWCDSSGNEYFHSNPKLSYRQHSFDVVDYIAGNIKEQFDQPVYSTYIKLQNIILKVSCCQDFRSELNSLEDLHKEDLNFFCIKVSAGITSEIRHWKTWIPRGHFINEKSVHWKTFPIFRSNKID